MPGSSRKSGPTCTLQVMIPAANGQVPKEWSVDMVRPGALRPDANWQATLSTLPPHQMLVLILSKDATTKFAAWNRMSAMIPSSVERDGGDHREAALLPARPADGARQAGPLVPSSDLDDDQSRRSGTAIRPTRLSVSQQQALLDWLHWGGQLILSGGAGQSYLAASREFPGPVPAGRRDR